MQQGQTGAGPAVSVIDAARALAAVLAHEIDPDLRVSVEPYTWHGETLADITLSWHGHAHHLQVSDSRLRILLRDPSILEHDMAGALLDLRREVAHGHDPAEHGAAETPHPPAPSPDEGHGSSSHDDHAGHAPAAPATHALAATIELPVYRPGMADPALAAPSTTDAESVTLAATEALARQIVAELEPHAEVACEDYLWHGERLLDIAVRLHGHEHRYQISAARAAIALRDHSILHHDLAGVVQELQREGHA